MVLTISLYLEGVEEPLAFYYWELQGARLALTELLRKRGDRLPEDVRRAVEEAVKRVEAALAELEAELAEILPP